MSDPRERLRLWEIEGFPAVRVRAAENTTGARPRWVMLHISTSEFHTAIQQEVLQDLKAVPELARPQNLRILGSDGLARPWKAPGLVFGEILVPDIGFWVHPLNALPEGISGVLGLDVLRRERAIIKLEQGWLTVSSETPAVS